MSKEIIKRIEEETNKIANIEGVVSMTSRELFREYVRALVKWYEDHIYDFLLEEAVEGEAQIAALFYALKTQGVIADVSEDDIIAERLILDLESFDFECGKTVRCKYIVIGDDPDEELIVTNDYVIYLADEGFDIGKIVKRRALGRILRDLIAAGADVRYDHKRHVDVIDVGGFVSKELLKIVRRRAHRSKDLERKT